MSASKIITLITGGNSGIGYETARQLLSDASRHVIICSRTASKGDAAVQELQSLKLPGSVEAVQLDVTSPSSIAAAASQVSASHGRVDAIVNNAGIAAVDRSLPIGQQMSIAFETNAIGPVQVLEGFGPLLAKTTTTPRIVNVSSYVGSITERLNRESRMYSQQAIHYRVSKTALNMVSACQTVEYGDGIGAKVFTYDPGFTVSNLSPMNRAENGARPTSESAAPIVALLKGERDAEHGGYVSAEGQVPW